MVNIIQFTREYRQSIIDCINQVSQECEWMLYSEFKPTSLWEKALLEQLDNALLLVAITESKVVGWCRLFLIENGIAELGMGVLEEYHHIGIGTKLITATITWAQNNQVKQINLDTASENARAQRLFHKFGFLITHQDDKNIYMTLFIEPQKESPV